MDLIIKKTESLHGTLTVPASKSQTVRALLIGALAGGISTVANVLESDDTLRVEEVLNMLGVEIEKNGTVWTVKSSGLPLKTTGKNFYTGDSGITTRFLLPLLGLGDGPCTLDASPQMRARPILPLVTALNRLGMQIETSGANVWPLKVSGNFLGGETYIDGTTSQYLSALLLASPYAGENTILHVQNLNEKPYVEMTLSWLKDAGILYERKAYADGETFEVKAGQKFKSLNVKIPGDFSSASCIIAAAALLGGEVQLKGLSKNDTQGDRKLVDILEAAGTDISWDGNELLVRGGTALKGGKVDANEVPDLLPALAVLGTKMQGGLEILNVKQARIKETDRIHSMAEGLREMGAEIEEKKDGLIVGQSQLKGACVDGFADHRTVMALSVAGLIAEGETHVHGAEAIKKTFPNFIEEMRALGANFTVEKSN
ncbi:MAG: 3-phosphoshikimate 1-carboxyvinyltransferase [Candidatus Gracilibacteria bacterium]|jgi:3-phosphoshikimate 1-carboxyvinyltransferase